MSQDKPTVAELRQALKDAHRDIDFSDEELAEVRERFEHDRDSDNDDPDDRLQQIRNALEEEPEWLSDG
jgi:predicted Zn-dependent peptidase